MQDKLILVNAINDANEMALALTGREIKTDFRSKVACACFAVAFEHHDSILILLNNNPPKHATACALLRLVLESTVRGLWLSHVATDEQIVEYPISGTKLDMASILLSLEKAGLKRAHEVITKVYKKLSSYTHTGELQVHRWLKNKDLEPRYSEDEIRDLIHHSSRTARLAFEAVRTITSEASK